MLAEVTEMMNGLPKPSHHDPGISNSLKPHPCLQTPNAPLLLEDFLRDKSGYLSTENGCGPQRLLQPPNDITG